MDAMRCKEWRIFPLTSFLNDKLGETVFMFVHIPLFYGIFFELIEKPNNAKFMVGFDYFFLVHLVLHLIFLKHPKNEFKDWKSWSIIIAAALFGLIDLLLKTK